MNLEQRWCGLLATDLRHVFSSEYSKIPSLSVISFQIKPRVSFWTKWGLLWRTWFAEWRGVVTR